MNTSEMKLKSVPANRISLGGIALIVAGIAVLAAILLLLGSPSNPHTEQLQMVLEADTELMAIRAYLMSLPKLETVIP